MRALSDASGQCPGVSGPIADFQVLPSTLFVTQMHPHTMMTCFLPAMPLFVCGIAVPISLSTIPQN